MQFREAALQTKLVSQACESTFKANILFIAAFSLQPSLTEFNLVLRKKIPTEDNLKFVFEKHEETEKIVGKKMR